MHSADLPAVLLAGRSTVHRRTGMKKSPVPPAGEMKLLLNFFSKKLRESRGQSPLAPSA